MCTRETLLMLPLPGLSVRRKMADASTVCVAAAWNSPTTWVLDGQAPEDPAEVLQTAIEAYHRGGFPGRYELVTVGEYFHIVPTARRDEDEEWEPIQSPLDTVVTLEGRNRLPDEVLTELRQRMTEAAGHEILEGILPLSRGNLQPRIVERFEGMKAREVLRSLIATTGSRHLWALLCGVRQDKSGTKRYRCVLNISLR